MKQAKAVSVSGKDGFTLVEVLIALAIAAVGFGVVLHSVGLQMTLVATSLERHQMLLFASQALEKNMPKSLSSDDTIEQTEEDIAAARAEQESGEESERFRPPMFVYRLNIEPVTADPRVQQVTVTVKGGRGQSQLSAYRLRVRRAESK